MWIYTLSARPRPNAGFHVNYCRHYYSEESSIYEVVLKGTENTSVKWSHEQEQQSNSFDSLWMIFTSTDIHGMKFVMFGIINTETLKNADVAWCSEEVSWMHWISSWDQPRREINISGYCGRHRVWVLWRGTYLVMGGTWDVVPNLAEEDSHSNWGG